MCVSKPSPIFNVYIHYPSAAEYFGEDKVPTNPICVALPFKYNSLTNFDRIYRVVGRYLSVDHHKDYHYAAQYYEIGKSFIKPPNRKARVRSWVKENGKSELHIRLGKLNKRRFIPHAVDIWLKQYPITQHFEPFIPDY